MLARGLNSIKRGREGRGRWGGSRHASLQVVSAGGQWGASTEPEGRCLFALFRPWWVSAPKRHLQCLLSLLQGPGSKMGHWPSSGPTPRLLGPLGSLPLSPLPPCMFSPGSVPTLRLPVCLFIYVSVLTYQSAFISTSHLCPPTCLSSV